MDRAGLVGADGPTHHGAYDIAFMRCVPNMILASPMNEEELRNLMYTAQHENHGPFCIRYPRGEGVMTEWKTPMRALRIGRGRKVRGGSDLAIISLGPIGNQALEACEILESNGMSVALYDLRFVKPIDEVMLHEVFSKFSKVITVEDGCIQGGMGSAVIEFMCDHGYASQVKRLGVPDEFIEHGSPEELFSECGYNTSDIVEAVESMLDRRKAIIAV